MASTSIGTAWIQIKPTTKGLRQAIDKELNVETGDAGSKAGTNWGNSFVGTLKTVITAAAIGNFIKDAIGVSADFGANISQIAATLGYSMSELNDSSSEAAQTMERLSAFAREMGETTVFTANESAQALNYMALAGYDAETAIKTLPTVLNLAAAGNFELATASDMVTDAQTALGLSLEQTNALVDQMARTASRSNTSVAQLGEGILTVGANARILKGGTAELAASLGLLADNGLKGTEGGTKLRNILVRLQKPTKNGKEALDNLGVSIFDAEGNIRSLAEIFPELQKGLQGLSDQERTAALGNIFNLRDLAAANALIETSTERWSELVDEIQNADGAAQEMASVQLDNLRGDITLLKSAFEGFQIALGGVLEPILRPLLQGLTNFFSFLAENEVVMDAFIAILTTVAGVLVTSLVPAIWATTTALLANPLTWIVVAIAAVVLGIIELIKHFDIVKEALGILWDNITTVFQGVVGWFSELWERFKSFINGIREAWGTFWNNLVTGVSEIATFIASAVSNIFKTAINSVLAFIENFINSPIRLINKFIGLINKAFGFVGVNIGLIGEIKLPRLAKGGIVAGVGTDTSDSNLYMLSKGEYVIKAASARQIGYDNLDRMNRTGETSGKTEVVNNITINGYEKDPNELATLISRKIALRTQGVF